MIIKKIISSGKPGTERAALDFAIKLDIPCGGWIPDKQSRSDGIIAGKYQLQEMPAASDTDLAEKNVQESDATLIISNGEIAGGAEVSRKFAMVSRRHLLHIDLYMTPALQAVSIISSWLRLNQIEILYVTGSAASKDPAIYQNTMYLLENALRVNMIKHIVDEFLDDPSASTHTVDDVVSRMISEISLKQKVAIANLERRGIETLQYALDLYISSRCKTAEISDMEKTGLYADEAYTVIVMTLWSKLHNTHKLRAIK